MDSYPAALVPGAFVFMVAKGEGKDVSHYYDGEFVVVSVGACNKSFQALKTVTSGYDAGQLHNFNYIGHEAREIYNDDRALLEKIESLEYFANEPERTAKTQWLAHVYEAATAASRILRRAYAKKTGRGFVQEAGQNTTKAAVIPDRQAEFSIMLGQMRLEIPKSALADAMISAGLANLVEGYLVPTQPAIRLARILQFI